MYHAVVSLTDDDLQTVSLRKAADLLDVSLSTVKTMVSAGELPAFKVRRQWRVKRVDLAALMS